MKEVRTFSSTTQKQWARGEGRGRPVNKLQTTRKGPMRVVSKQEDTYDLLDVVSGRVEIVYVSRINPFNFDATKVDPENVAIRNQGDS